MTTLPALANESHSHLVQVLHFHITYCLYCLQACYKSCSCTYMCVYMNVYIQRDIYIYIKVSTTYAF